MCVSPGLCALLLMGIVAEARTRIQPGDAEPFHARAAEAIASIPTRLDPTVWTDAEDFPIPTPAAELLHPNAIFSSSYVDWQAGVPVSGVILLVQCKDAVDMQGHYPPHCYPANGGRELQAAHARTWRVGDVDIPGTEYFFSMPSGPTEVRRWVYDFFIIPRIPGLEQSMQGLYPDIDAVYKSGGSYQRHYFGAAQFQFSFDQTVPQPQRDRFVIDFLTPNLPVIHTLLNDDAPATAQTATAFTIPGPAADPLNSGGIRP
jgi:hypothetical protein